MLLLVETPAGYGLLKLVDKSKLENVDSIWDAFATPESAQQVVKLKAFHKFADTQAALSAAAAICEGTLDPNLAQFLKESVLAKDIKSKIGVADTKLGALLKEQLGIKCIYDEVVLELLRGVRNQIDSLIGLSENDRKAMRLGLSHSLARYKLRFSPDKVDTMIIQAISLLDEIDKELNTYAMRVREWYGWHFPEMGKVVVDNIMYAKAVKKMGVRTNASHTDFSDCLPEEIEGELKQAAEVSMGTELAEEDVINISHLCTEVIAISEYRASLFDYLKNRMAAIAPNLTVMVGELVGARLIAHAGSLMSLAKHPASTVQILGAEKALFRALKTKHDTPKYGLIYHASLVGQAPPKLKGKISRVLAAKTALAIRMDALGDTDKATIGFDGRVKVETRLNQLNGGKIQSLSGTGKNSKSAPQEKFAKPSAIKEYNAAADSTLSSQEAILPFASDSKSMDIEGADKKKDKKKKDKKEEKEQPSAPVSAEPEADKKKKKKDKKKEAEETPAAAPAAEAEAEKKKKKKEKRKREEEAAAAAAPAEEETGEKKKKKQKKSDD